MCGSAPWLLLNFSLLVVLPHVDCRTDVMLLPFLCASDQQNHKMLTISTKVDPVSGPEINFEFEYSISNTFDIREITLSDPDQCSCNLCGSWRVQSVEPFFE